MKYFSQFFLLFFCFSLPTLAETTNDLMPAHGTVKISATAPQLHVTMDRSELVRLENDAASIIVGNPFHANVLMDNPRLLVVVPRAPGTTHFTVLDQNGNVILQRHLIIAAPQENYLRIRRAHCGDNECVHNASYYCPDMCHEIRSEESEDIVSSGATEETANEEITPDPAITAVEEAN